MTRNIAIIGHGRVGSALGQRFSHSGHQVTFGVRAGGDASDAVAACGERARSAPMADAVVGAEIVFLAVPGNAAVAVAQELAAHLDGTIVVDCSNTLRWDNGPVWNPPAEGSMAQAIAAAVPGARVVKGFNAFGAEFHGNPNVAGRAIDVFLAGEDADAKAVVSDVGRDAGFEMTDAGPLRNAALLENLAVLWIHLSRFDSHGRSFAFTRLFRE